jgi:homogentisate 1,2-dioxygenase
MNRRFDHVPGDRVIFSPGAEAQAAEALAGLGARRVLLLAQGRHRAGADRVAAALGPRCAGVFDGVTVQVPEDVVAAALAAVDEAGADWVVAHGGGSAIGVAKAAALQREVAVGAIPTTYAGSERTDIYGLIEGGHKRTGRDARVRPRLVIYDPALTAGLPRDLTLRSLLNALAHSVEALYAVQATPVARAAARESLGPLWRGLAALSEAPGDLEARSEALYGAYLAATALNGASMALHHKLAHVLGGSFGAPHAHTHATLLPYTLGFNAPAAPGLVAALRSEWGVADPPGALYDRMRAMGLETSLRALELTPADIARAAEIAAEKSYPNPRPLDRGAFSEVLDDALHDRRPSLFTRRVDLGLSGHHRGHRAAVAGPPLEAASAAVVVLHGRGSSADRTLATFQDLAGPAAGPSVAWIAPQADGNTWYPKGFLAPEAENQPALDGALEAVQAAWERAAAAVGPERVIVTGFSQGACLLLTWLGAASVRPAAAVAMTGAAMDRPLDFSALTGVPVSMARAEDDAWVPDQRFRDTARALEAAGALVEAEVVPGDAHTHHPACCAALRRALETLMNDELTYQSGFGNALASEARPGALPARQSTPKRPPYGLYAEQINGTGFTLERAHNLRVWLYRLRPAIHSRGFEAHPAPPPHFTGRFEEALAFPEALRFRPAPAALPGTDWLDGVQTFAGAGDPSIKRGVAIHLFSADTDMRRVFCNIDGDLLLAPWAGRLRVRTELGWLEAGPEELLILPRGIRFQVFLPDHQVSGFAAELYDGHFQLPERGLVGANGLADERHFKAPVASYEDRTEDTAIVVKQGGRFWRTVAPSSPFDVVAWRGNYAPYKYNLRDFMSYGSVSFDHPDPSILTVLTSPMDTRGRNAIDVGAFIGRWDPTEDTFRPPYFHRNSAIEFNAVLRSPNTTGPYPAGAFSYTPYLTPHGVSNTSVDRATAASDEPARGSDESIWLQLESTYALKVLPRWLDSELRDTDFLENFQGYTTGELVGR